jgi:DNA polymerase III epsilon subunit-like protein
MMWLVAAGVLTFVLWIVMRPSPKKPEPSYDRERVDNLSGIPQPRIEEPPPPPIEAAPVVRIIERRSRVAQARAGSDSKLAFLDVETTGFSGKDRVVTLGLFTVRAGDLLQQLDRGSYALDGQTLHYVFNPERPNTAAAEATHGWEDKVLAHQPLFATEADRIYGGLAAADIWLAHNVAFDVRFITQEFERLGRSLPDRGKFCTMLEARERWPGRAARLETCIRRIGLSRGAKHHGALEDALLCAALYTFLETGNKWRRLPPCGLPTNYIPVPGLGRSHDQAAAL